jgi:hypothetical protein
MTGLSVVSDRRPEHFGGGVCQWLATFLRDEPGELGLPRFQ